MKKTYLLLFILLQFNLLQAFTLKPISESLMNESQTSIKRGALFLLNTQNKDGSWTFMHEPAITSLALIALLKAKQPDLNKKIDAAVNKARKFILSKAQKNGSIAGTKSQYVNYSTSICLLALATLNNPDDIEIMRKSRHFLISMQDKGLKSPDYLGGIGYGSSGPGHPDLSNTSWALEALYATNFLDTEQGGATKKDIQNSKLAWKNALKFLKAVQNIPKDAGETWVVNDNDSKNDGGFIYKPNDSKVNSKFKIPKNKGLRAYGTMTYAGLKSMIFAELNKEDYRVKAAMQWIKKHYTLSENPEMGPEGLFYYLQCFAKANAVMNNEVIVDNNGIAHNWKIDMIKKLLAEQNGDGSWTNKKSSRWMESVPELVTAYALFSLELATTF